MTPIELPEHLAQQLVPWPTQGCATCAGRGEVSSSYVAALSIACPSCGELDIRGIRGWGSGRVPVEFVVVGLDEPLTMECPMPDEPEDNPSALENGVCGTCGGSHRVPVPVGPVEVSTRKPCDVCGGTGALPNSDPDSEWADMDCGWCVLGLLPPEVVWRGNLEACVVHGRVVVGASTHYKEGILFVERELSDALGDAPYLAVFSQETKA